jgi:hypothetical protein
MMAYQPKHVAGNDESAVRPYYRLWRRNKVKTFHAHKTRRWEANKVKLREVKFVVSDERKLVGALLYSVRTLILISERMGAKR